MNIFWDILNFWVGVDTVQILYWLLAFVSEKCQDPAAMIGVLLLAIVALTASSPKQRKA